MQYPENPGPCEWYLDTNTAKAWNSETLTHEWRMLGKAGEPPKTNDTVWYFNHKSDKYVTGLKHFQAQHYDCVYVGIKRPGDSTSITLGCVDVTAKDFPERWREIIVAGKQRVDMLNSMDKTLGYSDLQCANCEKQAMTDDYLCSECRNGNND